MRKLIVMRGIPGSGKSTRAKALQAAEPLGNVVIINRDFLREMLFGGAYEYGHGLEEYVVAARDVLITEYLAMHRAVIVDDTNLTRRHMRCLKELAVIHNAPIQVEDLRDVPLATCLAQDGLRMGKAHVGQDVILKMNTLMEKERRKEQESLERRKAEWNENYIS